MGVNGHARRGELQCLRLQPDSDSETAKNPRLAGLHNDPPIEYLAFSTSIDKAIVKVLTSVVGHGESRC